MNPLTKIPAKYRLWIYGAWFVAGVVIGACQVAGLDVDRWLDVYGYVSIAFGLTAASNVTREDTPPPVPDNNPLR